MCICRKMVKSVFINSNQFGEKDNMIVEFKIMYKVKVCIYVHTWLVAPIDVTSRP